MSNHENRLIHVLLRETLGGETPPDLTEPILGRAFGVRTRRRRWAVGVAAAAALLVLAAGVWLAREAAYPAPRATGEYYVVGGGRVGRGAVVATKRRPAQLALGGYCRVDMEPNTRVRIAGQPRAERVFLERGGLRCNVDRAGGEFAVEADAGTVSVKGTDFVVELMEERGGTEMIGKRMFVRVLAGVVLLHGAWGSFELAAGEDATVPPKGRIVAGRPRYLARNHDAWREKGRVIGPVRQGPKCEVAVLDAAGKVAKSANLAAGAKGFELGFLAPGVYTLRVTAADYATLAVKGLEVRVRNDLSIAVEFVSGEEQPAPQPEGKRIVSGRPRYLARNGDAWREKGRIIGAVRQGPKCQVAALNAAGAVVKSANLAAGARGFELGFLAPGAYTLRVTAEGYPKLEVKGLEVRAKTDVSIAIEFEK